MPDSKVEVKAMSNEDIKGNQMEKINIVFSGEMPNLIFVEVEDVNGKSVSVGEWIKKEEFSILQIPMNTRSPIANNGVSFDSIVDKLTHLNGDHLMGLELNDIHIIANFITRLQPTAPRGGGEEQS